MPVLKIVADEAGLSAIGVVREDNPELYRIVDAIESGVTFEDFAKANGVDTTSKVKKQEFYLKNVQCHKTALKNSIQRAIGDRADVEIEWKRFAKAGGGRPATRKVKFRLDTASVMAQLLASCQ